MLEPINFQEPSEIDSLMRSSINDIASDYDNDYWTRIHREKEFPDEIWQELADGGWLGVVVPEEYGGEGQGMVDVVRLIEELAMEGGWSMATHLLYAPVFGGITIKHFGSEEQKETWLPKIVDGEAMIAIGVTEPDAGVNTTSIRTRAERDCDEFVINGTKIWTSSVDRADRIALVARTQPVDAVEKPSRGLSVFLVDPESEGIEYDIIPEAGWMPDNTFNLYLDDVRVHESQLVGEEGAALQQFFDTLNAERIATAAQMFSTGLYALELASDYASGRTVYGETPIGQYQGIQHPLADAYSELMAARLMTYRAAWLFDSDSTSAGRPSNVANLESGKAAWNAIDAAIQTHGGMSISEEVGLPWMSDLIRHLRIGPIPEEMLRNYIAENELGLPRSY